jgi:hypothetical protein
MPPRTGWQVDSEQRHTNLHRYTEYGRRPCVPARALHSGLDNRESIIRFIRALSYETHGDINTLRRQDFTWFHWHEFQTEMQSRTALKNAYDQMLSVVQARLDNPLR